MRALSVALALSIAMLSGCGGGGGGGVGGNVVNAEDQLIALTLSDTLSLTEITQLATQGTGIGATMSPLDLRGHYNIPATLDGTGTTIVIVDAPGSNDIAKDLVTFNAQYGLPPCNFQLIDKRTNPNVISGSDWAIEVALDVEWAHAIAPGAKIVLVTAASASLSDMMAALGTAVAQPNVVAVSMSWGVGEFSAETSAKFDGFFKQYPNIAFLASSGDNGNNGSNQTWPAASPYVTAVGGTTINKLGPLGFGSESAWRLGGGGASLYETMPTYQKTSGMLSDTLIALNKGKRAIPDISYNADGRTSPVGVYTKGKWYAVGGTSAGAPQWAGIVALWSQYMTQKKSSLSQLMTFNGGLNGILYQAKLEQVSKTSLFDITSGSNNTGVGVCMLCTSGTGYDDVTGLGVPNVGNLLGYF